MHSTTFKENQTQPISTHTSHQLWNTVVEVVMIWVSYSQWVDCELLCIPTFYRVQCDVLKLLLLKFCPFIFIKCKLKSVLMLKDWILLLPLKACTALHMQMNLLTFSLGLPENFLGPKTLKVSAHWVQALKCGLHIQWAKHIFGAHPVKVKGDAGYVFPSTWFVVVLSFGHNCTLGGIREIRKLSPRDKKHTLNPDTASAVKPTCCDLHVCPGSRAMSMTLSGRVMRNSSESTSVPSSSQTRDRDTADSESSNAWHTCQYEDSKQSYTENMN